VRKLLEALAQEEPLVVVLEDIHWAEPTFLDLIEEVAELSRDYALLLLCLARPELLEEREGWGGGKLSATSLLVEPLTEGESDLLIDRLLGASPLEPDARRRIAEAAEGNPLFVEQMLALIGEAEREDGELSVPATIQALLAARLDRLGPGERAVIEAAAVVGKEFWAESVAELLPEEAHAALPRHLDGLVRKELVRPRRSPFFGLDGYRFRHILIQDATYRAIPKQLRAELHERFASWLDRRDEAGEFIEILGYHYEQASLYRAELDPGDPEVLRLAETASELLVRAGIRAGARDWTAAENLLERAGALLPAVHQRRARILLELGHAYRQRASFKRSRAVLTEAVDTARRTGDEQVELLASTVLAADAFSLSSDAPSFEKFRAAARLAAETMKPAGDNRWLAISLRHVAFTHLLELRFAEAEELLLRALEAARSVGDAFEEAFVLDQLAYALIHGPTATSDALDLLQKLDAGRGPSSDRSNLAILNAMRGDFDEARRLAEEASEMAEATGRTIRAALALLRRGEVEELAGDLATAERYISAGHELGESIGYRYAMADSASLLASLMVEQGRDDEALAYTELSEAYGGGRPGESQLRWRMARARVLARRDEFRDAERLAREVLDAVPPDSGAYLRAGHLVRYAEILGAHGDSEEARNALREALALAERKEDVVTAGRARAALDALSASARRPRSGRRAGSR
jgi:tetratricopeptide (TPR) repeat protein